MIDREPCRLENRGIADLPAVGHDNDVGAVYLLGVQPDVVLGGSFECKLVVLAVVPADENFKSVARLKFQRRQGGRLGLSALGLAQIILLQNNRRYRCYRISSWNRNGYARR